MTYARKLFVTAMAGAVVAAAVVARLLWRAPAKADSRTGSRSELARSLGERRLIEPRLAGGFRYQPWRAASAPGERPAPPAAFLAAAAALRERATIATDAETSGALGAACLLLGETAEAVRVLQEASRHATSDAALRSDLSAAYLVRAGRDDRPEDLARALDSAEAALATAGAFPEALFNRALALESLGLVPPAEETWSKLARANAGGWTAEARSHLSALRRSARARPGPDFGRSLDDAAESDPVELGRLVALDPQAVRLHVEDVLLARWAAEETRGDTTSARGTLLVARRAAEALKAFRGESLAYDSVVAIERATGESRMALAAGHRLYAEGRSLYRSQQAGRAISALDEARSALIRGRSPFELMAALNAASARYIRSDFGGVLALVRKPLAPGIVAERHVALRAQLRWLCALAYQGRSPNEIKRLLLASVADFEAIGERENVAAVHNLLSEACELVGDTEEAWRHRLLALGGVTSPARQSVILTEAATTALGMGLPRAAVVFADLAVRVALADGSRQLVAYGLLWRSVSQHRSGDRALAGRDLEAARRATLTIEDDAVRRQTSADVELAQVEIARSEDPQAAVASISKTLDALRAARTTYRFAEFLLERGRLQTMLGRNADAETDLLEGLAVLESEHVEISGEADRVRHMNARSELYDAAVQVLVRNGKTELAWSWAERSRARSLLDVADPRSGAGIPDVLSREEIRSALPVGVAVVAYSCLPDTLLTWVLTRETSSLDQKPAPRALLAELATAATGKGEAARASGRRLHDLLISGIDDKLRGAQTLVVVPDATLAAVPFPALAGADGRPLIIERTIAIAPSATLFVLGERRLRGVALARGGVLVVGNPAFDRKAFPELRALPAAAEEATRIAALHGGHALVGASATRSVFLSALEQSRVIHFAGHALVNGRHPDSSALILAPDGPDDFGTIYAREIAERRLAAAPIVFLAGCSTAQGPLARGEGPLSLTRAFLRAGASAVVATLRDVGDETAARMSMTFHKRLLRGDNAAKALREAQVDEMERNRSIQGGDPSDWAAFELFGSPGVIRETILKR